MVKLQNRLLDDRSDPENRVGGDQMTQSEVGQSVFKSDIQSWEAYDHGHL